MLQYIKDRYKEYASYASPNNSIAEACPDIIANKQDNSIDYEIYYGGTTILIDTISISKSDMAQNLSKSLILSISDALSISVNNVMLISVSIDTVICEVSYTKKHSNIRFELKRAKTPKVRISDPDDYNETDFYSFGM